MFKKIFYIPLYNALIWLVGFLPGGSVGWAVVLLTLAVKVVLAPLSIASIRSQMKQKKLQPEMERIKKEFPDRQEQSQKMMELYKEKKTNPFSGCLLVLIQIPIIFALYKVFLEGLSIDPTLLYKGIAEPELFDTMFLGIDLGAKSIIFALIAGITQFIQIRLSPTFNMMGSSATDDKNKEKEGGADEAQPDPMKNMGSIMQKQMKYMMPIIITVVAYIVPAAVALYWIVNNIVTIITEVIAKKMAEKDEDADEVVGELVAAE